MYEERLRILDGSGSAYHVAAEHCSTIYIHHSKSEVDCKEFEQDSSSVRLRLARAAARSISVPSVLLLNLW